ncbi:MAG: hypothetical protein CSA89_00900 [Bacteroidales bacterium]|nr:MAG: hypothetical protein CSA89_00900 [Bacteroidales bacterium]
MNKHVYFFRKTVIALMFAMYSSIAFGQSVDIVEALRTPNSSGVVVDIHQSEAISYVLNQGGNQKRDVELLSDGWAVQIFSDNSVGAMEEAFRIETMVKELLPYEYVKAVRIPPFWKVRVGQFEHREKAERLKEHIVKELPELKGYAYIVKFNNN